MEELLEALSVVAGDPDKMSVEDFKYSMTNSGEAMHEHEIKEILEDLSSVVYDGSIYLEEFAKMIYNK